MAHFTRREFIGSSLGTGAALALTMPAFSQTSAANDLNVGLIGCGGRGTLIIRSASSQPNVNVTWLCDPDTARTDKLKEQYAGAQTCTDLRQMLDDDSLDAVMIATCNHWHCLAAAMALEAGKHVYVEKPLSHTQREGQQLIDAVKRSGKLLQVGTQQRSDPMQRQIKQFLHEERAIGELQSVTVNRFGVRGSIGKRSQPLAPPQTVVFNQWVGPAALDPLFRNHLHYDWHWDWNTGSGEMGNWGVHIIDDVRNNVFLDEVAYPKTIAAAGGRYVWNDAGTTPNLHYAQLDTGSIPVAVGVCNVTESSSAKGSPNVHGPGSGYVVYGEGGQFHGQRGGGVAYDTDGKVIKKFSGDAGSQHQKHFIDAIRTGDASLLSAPVEVGHHSTAWCNLANIAWRAAGEIDQENAPVFESGQAMLDTLKATLAAHGDETKVQMGPTLTFDAESQRFTGNLANRGNALLDYEHRSGFTMPTGA